MEFFDSHAHLNLPEFASDRVQALGRARDAGVTRMVNVGVDAETARLARDLSRENEGLFATAAVHPNYVADEGEAGFAAVEALLREGGFVAVGETGLDYYREHSPHALQRECFRRHIALADELALPVIVHCREAYDDCYRILADESERRELAGRVVMHCFGGTAEEARRFSDLGMLISFSGIVTFKNAHEIREAAAAVPLGRTLAETDCPYLAPQARRGKRNEPAYVTWVVEALAGVHEVSVSDAARATTENAMEFFEIESQL